MEEFASLVWKAQSLGSSTVLKIQEALLKGNDEDDLKSWIGSHINLGDGILEMISLCGTTGAPVSIKCPECGVVIKVSKGNNNGIRLANLWQHIKVRAYSIVGK